MVDFVRSVRALLDATSRSGQRRRLGVRIPCRLDRHAHIGVEVGAFHDAGVDIFNLCSSFFTEQQSDIGEVARRLPAAKVYLECTSAASLGTFLGGYDQSFRRMTDEQFYTAGHLAYSRGGAGISTFNFVYYRQHHDNAAIGPFSEPPFHVYKGLADPAFVARQPQHYFVPNLHGGGLLANALGSGASHEIALDLAPPAGGWKRDGRLRIQGGNDIAGGRWTAHVNGQELAPTAEVGEPYASPYPNCLGKAGDYRAWTVPTKLLRDGINAVRVTAVAVDQPVKLCYLDLSLP